MIPSLEMTLFRRESARPSRVPPPVHASMRTRIRESVERAALPADQRPPMEAMLAIVRGESLGLDAATLESHARAGIGLMAVSETFAAAFHRLRCALTY